MNRAIIVLAGSLLEGLAYAGQGSVALLYKKLIVACVTLPKEQLAPLLHVEWVDMSDRERDLIVPEIVSRWGAVMSLLREEGFSVVGNNPSQPFETMQFRPTVTGGTAVERWRQPEDRDRFNPVVENTSMDFGIKVALLTMLVND